MQIELQRKTASTWDKDIYAEEIPKSGTANGRKVFYSVFFLSIPEV